jgi:hypothetical protein
MYVNETPTDAKLTYPAYIEYDTATATKFATALTGFVYEITLFVEKQDGFAVTPNVADDGTCESLLVYCDNCPYETDTTFTCLIECHTEEFVGPEETCVDCSATCASQGCVMAGDQCIECGDNPNCTACDADFVCTDCNIDSTLDGSSDCKCNDGYFPDTDTKLCTECHDDCSTCVDGSNTSCLTCSDTKTTWNQPVPTEFNADQCETCVICTDFCPSMYELRVNGSAQECNYLPAMRVEFLWNNEQEIDKVVDTYSITGDGDPGTVEPIPIIDRGIWFDGSNKMLLKDLTIPASLAFNLWIKLDTPAAE